MCQWALTERQTLGSGGALQRGHSASLEPLAQRNDALSVGNELVIIVVVPTNKVATEPRGRKTAVQQCQWALTEKRTVGVAAHLSTEILVSLRTAASAEAPSGPMLFQKRLPGGWAGAVREQVRVNGR